ncbi:AAA family ATPase [Polluticaenibacter yanchengensis]|uniref:AAA family ATPase n=1 Tax=Polluticaenibacter yanchengensis TaxID=3014562 RepID=A0ABT4UIY4_9BACT|nr:hypothetical protein [Chitinophagaceae bacterium LY-5]
MTENKIQDIIKTTRISRNENVAEEQPILTISGATVMSSGNISAFIGKPKSKKTFGVELFMRVILTSKKNSNLINDNSFFSTRKRIIWFDTEQSRGLVKKIETRLIEVYNTFNIPIEVYSLRPLSVSERIDVITQILYTGNENHDIAIAVIDGIRDLVTDINDAKQATEILSLLMRITDNTKMHIATVLHVNKSDNNARGHLGTELVNKAETVMLVEKDSKTEHISYITPEHTRQGSFKPITFYIDENICPKAITQKEANIILAQNSPFADMTEIEHKKTIVRVYRDQEELLYSELLDRTSKVTKKGDALARQLKEIWISQDFITHNGQRGKAARYKINFQLNYVDEINTNYD